MPLPEERWMLGTKTLRALECIASLEGEAEAYTCSHTEPSNLDLGFINRTVAAKLANNGFLYPLVPGEPLRLTEMSRIFLSQLHSDQVVLFDRSLCNG
jgi:hypothetical protein